jgi:excisionase family DNA binding protein
MNASDTTQLKTSELMTVKEVASLLKVTPNSVYRMVERRLVRFFKIRSGIRFAKSDIEAYLRECCVEAINDNEYGGKKN